MSLIDSLCEGCWRLNLLEEFAHFKTFQADRNTPYNPYPDIEGSISDLIQRPPCKFCELVLHLLAQVDVSNNNSLEYGLRMLPDRICVVGRYRNTDEYENYGDIYALPGSTAEDLPVDYLGTDIIDFERILLAIAKCEESHESCRAQRHNNREYFQLRLIDAVEKKIVSASSNEKYFALSYVWGKVDMLVASTATIAELGVRNGLEKYWNEIPRVIQDAMHITQALKCRYLWVDTLCILQDNVIEKESQISRMDVVYSNAELTIAAVSAQDAKGTLAGIQKGTRPRPRHFAQVGSSLWMAQPPFDLLLNYSNSKYSSRGWTFQEEKLSTRCLYICQKQVFFRCQENVWYEIQHLHLSRQLARLDHAYYGRLGTYLMKPINDEPLARSYQSAVPTIRRCRQYHDMLESYTWRELTYESDILRAFQGIIERLGKIGFGRFCYGIPESIFDFALLWYPTNMNEPRRLDFPSWCWAGWKSKMDGHLPQALYWADEPSPWKFESVIQSYKLIERSGSRFIERVHFLPPASEAGLEDLCIETTTSGDEIEPSNSQFLVPVLQFRTQSVGLGALVLGSTEDSHRSSKREPRRLFNTVGEECGKLYVHNIDSFSDSLLDDREKEFIILSRQDYPESLRDVADGDSLDSFPEPWLFANVLLIHWQGELATRIGVGQILYEIWISLKPKIRDINLA